MPMITKNISGDQVFTILFVGVCGMIIVGLLLLWAASWTRQLGVKRSSPTLTGVLTVAGIAALLSGIYIGIVLLVGPLCILVWIVLTEILLASAMRYLRSEARALVAMLAVAAERGIPLAAVARAFADERSGIVSVRAARLADYLNAAVPLSVALKRSGTGFRLFPPELCFAADVGERSGRLGVCLTRALDQLEDLDRTSNSAWQKFLYIGGIVAVGIAILTFVMIKIVPVFADMFGDYGLELPHATQLLVTMSNALVDYWYVTVPFLLLIGVIVMFSMLSYMDVSVSMRSIPIIRRIYAPLDNAFTMRMLALTVREKRSVVEGLHLLAGYFPIAAARLRLDRAARRAVQGMPWQDAMQSSKLIGRREKVVLQSAERTGNLTWALDELAKTKIRRWTERLRAAMSLVFPILIFVVGLGVMFVAVSLMLPLFKLISALS